MWWSCKSLHRGRVVDIRGSSSRSPHDKCLSNGGDLDSSGTDFITEALFFCSSRYSGHPYICGVFPKCFWGQCSVSESKGICCGVVNGESNRRWARNFLTFWRGNVKVMLVQEVNLKPSFLHSLLLLTLNAADWYSRFGRTQPFPHWDTKTSLKILRLEGMRMVKPTERAGEQKELLHKALELMWSYAAGSQKKTQWGYCNLQRTDKPMVFIQLCGTGEQQNVLSERFLRKGLFLIFSETTEPHKWNVLKLSKFEIVI